jgi:hypothetical protein
MNSAQSPNPTSPKITMSTSGIDGVLYRLGVAANPGNQLPERFDRKRLKKHAVWPELPQAL